VFEKRTRLDVALLDLSLERLLTERARASRDLGEHRRADAPPAVLREHRDVGERQARPRLDEPAGDRRIADAGDEVRKIGLRVEVVPKARDSRPGLRRDEPSYVDHRLEIGVGLGRRDRELRELECRHGVSS